MENTRINPKAARARAQGLLFWQQTSYPEAHHDRRNLALHVLSVPLFIAGSLATVAAPAFSVWLLPAGVAAMFVAIAAQGKGHALESQAPAPFEGPRDVLARIFAEQWITFPRFVLSGDFARAWRNAA